MVLVFGNLRFRQYFTSYLFIVLYILAIVIIAFYGQIDIFHANLYTAATAAEQIVLNFERF